jgi:23S rRNA (pseudouridine1915-N3)-methyltransferase
MRILVAAIGRLKDGPERELVARYHERALQTGRALGMSVDLRELPESRARSAVERKREEAATLCALLPPDAYVICLDERGQQMPSVTFSGLIEKLRDGGASSLAVIIGGADGLGEEIAQRARTTIAFGAMTWPHQLVRVLLLEQIYRAMTIIQGHPYHRE